MLAQKLEISSFFPVFSNFLRNSASDRLFLIVLSLSIPLELQMIRAQLCEGFQFFLRPQKIAKKIFLKPLLYTEKIHNKTQEEEPFWTILDPI